MNEARKALNASIRKYRNVVKLLEDNLGKPIERNGGNCILSGKNIPFGTTGCPLCNLYFRNYECSETCCIKQDTKKDVCIGTPYNKYEDYIMSSMKVNKRLINAAKKELEYLVGLRKRIDKEGNI